MRFWITIALYIFLVLPSELRAQENAFVDRISSLRLSIERIEDAASAVRKHRDTVSAQHESLASQIKNIKEGLDNSLLPNFPLESKLRKSQQLSRTLTLLNRELEALQKAKIQKLQQLDEAYTNLLEHIVNGVGTASDNQKQQLVKLMKKARTERAAVRTRLSSEIAPFHQPDSLDENKLLASDDPEELSERADAIRDEQDKLRKELAFLNDRIKQFADEKRLEREMRSFVGDQDIFNESSRVLVVATPSVQRDSTGSKNEGDGFDYAGGTNETDGDGLSAQQPSGGSLAFDGVKKIPDTGDESQCLPTNQVHADETTGQLEKRREWIVKRLKKLQIIYDRILEHMDEIDKE